MSSCPKHHSEIWDKPACPVCKLEDALMEIAKAGIMPPIGREADKEWYRYLAFKLIKRAAKALEAPNED